MSNAIIAAEGYVYTNGIIYGNEIYLSNTDEAAAWREIPAEEADTIIYKVEDLPTYGRTSLELAKDENGDFIAAQLVIYARAAELKYKPVAVGILYSDWYCFEDELTLDNADVARMITTEITDDGGYAIAVRGLTEYDECYFRPFAVYEIAGELVAAYGDVLINQLFYNAVVNMPMTLELTDDDYSSGTTESGSELLEWMIANGFENAGITTYYVGE